MKLKTLPAALLAAIPLFAAAAGNETVLYGQANLGFEVVGGDGVPTQQRLCDYSSRLGFKGVEDLGEGMRAVFQIETGVRLDDASASAFASRDSYVGVAGSFGEVRLGRGDTPYKLVTGALDLFGSRTSSYSTLFHNQGAGWNNGILKYDIRQGNAISYWTPLVGGVQGNIMYSPDEAKGNGFNRMMFAASVKYVQGPMSLGGSYERHDDSDAAKNDTHGWQVFGTYTLPGNIFLGAGAESVKQGPEQRPAFLLAGTYPIDRLTLKAIYGWANDTGAKDSTGKKLDNGARHVSVGFDYALSKRTNLIGFYSRIDNDAQGTYEFTANPAGTNRTTSDAKLLNSSYRNAAGAVVTGIAGKDSYVFTLGIMSKF